MAEAKYTDEQINEAIVDRFTKWTNFLRARQATPTICIASGHVGDRRSEAELVLCMPDSLNVDWMIEALEATLSVVRAEKARQGG